MHLENQVALVTGGARGIGAAIARLFVENGASVVVADRRDDEGQQTVDELNALRENSALFCSLDIASEADWANATALTEQKFGKLNILVNNAGIIRVAPIAELTADTFRKVIDTNLTGTFLGLKAAIEPMKRAGGGSIINFSSVQGLEGRQGFSSYSASKFGVRALTKTAAIELGPLGIRVNTVIPGPTITKMTERPGWTREDYDRAYGKYPLGRMANPSEVAEMVVFLASQNASYCTGGDFVVDGGLTVGKPRD